MISWESRGSCNFTSITTLTSECCGMDVIANQSKKLIAILVREMHDVINCIHYEYYLYCQSGGLITTTTTSITTTISHHFTTTRLITTDIMKTYKHYTQSPTLYPPTSPVPSLPPPTRRREIPAAPALEEGVAGGGGALRSWQDTILQNGRGGGGRV